jgi:hypothetical protein
MAAPQQLLAVQQQWQQLQQQQQVLQQQQQVLQQLQSWAGGSSAGRSMAMLQPQQHTLSSH